MRLQRDGSSIYPEVVVLISLIIGYQLLQIMLTLAVWFNTISPVLKVVY